MHPQPPRMSRVQLAIFGIGERQRPACRTQHRWFRVIGGPVIPARKRAILAGLIGQHRARFAPDPRLAGPDREFAAIERKETHLLPAAPQHIIRANGEIDGDAIMRGQRLDREPPVIGRKPHRHLGGFIHAGKHISAIGTCALAKPRCGTQPVAEAEVAAHHRHLRIARTDCDGGRIRSVADNSTPTKQQGESILMCSQLRRQLAKLPSFVLSDTA